MGQRTETLRGGLRVAGGLLVLVGVLWPARAQAELTVLPILRDRRASEALTQSVAERLQLLGEEPAAVRTTLSSAELACALPSCLTGLATRLQAMRLLQGSVVSSAPRRYSLQLVLFERGSGRIQRQDSACEDCSDRQLQDLLASMAARLVDGSGRGAAVDRPAVGAATRTTEAGGSGPSQATERRLAELSEQLKADRAQQQKAREQLEALVRSSEAQVRALDALRGWLDKTRDGQDRLRDTVDKARGSIDKVRGDAERSREGSERTQETAERLRQTSQDAQKEAREGAKRTQASVEALRGSVDKNSESGQKVQASVEALRGSIDKNSESGLKVQASVEALRGSVDKNSESGLRVQASVEALRGSVERTREAVDGSRAAADASRAAAERLGPAFERVTQGLDAARHSAATAAEASQTGNQLASKALAGVEQLNALSGDLRTALTQVEPLRQAAEQTQTTAQANAKQSSEILSLVKQTRAASTETLQQAGQALTMVRVAEARRALPRSRKIGAGILGAVGLLLTGVTVTLSALNGYVPDAEAYCVIGGQPTKGCPLEFSRAYIPLSAMAASVAAAGSIAFLSVPVRP